MILVDTSVWVNHFRTADARLTDLLVDGQVLCHPFVVRDAGMRQPRQQGEVLDLLRALPRLPALTSEEALEFIDAHRLMGKGLGWVDVHLLGSAYVAREELWTKDRRLGEAAQRLGLTG